MLVQTNYGNGHYPDLAFGFSAKNGTPIKPEQGSKLADTLFKDEIEAIKEGTKIIRAK